MPRTRRSGALDILRREAENAAFYRYHDLGAWHSGSEWRPYEVESAECKRCGAYVQIDVRPPPNGIDVGGTAVAVNCEESPRYRKLLLTLRKALRERQ